MKRYLLICSVLLIASLVWFACSKVKEKPVVTVTIQPQLYFAQKIAGNKFTIHCMVPAGSSPETYDPSPAHLVLVDKSVAYLKIGYIGFEMAWMDKIIQNNPDMKVFDTSKGIDLIKGTHVCMVKDDSHLHDEGIDPHTWTSPKCARIIAKNMLDSFVELDEKNKSFYTNNYDQLINEINVTDSIITAEIAGSPNHSFIIYHPSLSYFARDYGLKQYSIEDSGKEPSAFHLKQLIDTVKVNDVKIMFIQQEFDVKNAQVIAKEVGCNIITINPLNYKWSEELIMIAKGLRDGYIN